MEGKMTGSMVQVNIFVGIVIVFCLFGVSAVSATDLWVDDDPGCGGKSPCNTSIQDAVDASSTGSTIIVRDGSYPENIKVDKRLTIRSENGSSGCVVQAVDPNDHVFNVSADHVNISGFTISGASGFGVAGVYLSSNHGSITDNIASNNHYGFSLWSSSNNLITNSTSTNNNYGIYLYYSHNNTITNSTTNDNVYGIYLSSSSNNTITSSTAEENTAYDLYVNAYSQGCDNRIQDLTGSNDLPILYHNSSVDLEDQVVSELVLCDADNSNIINVTVNASQTKRNNGVILMTTDDTVIRDSDSSGNNWGFYLFSSSNNLITNSTSTNNRRGIYFYSSDYNTITNSTSNDNGYGIYFYSSDYNTITNSTAEENTAYDLYVYAYSQGCDNRIQDLTGSNDLPILYHNSSVDLEDQVVSELVLCDADNSNIINVTVNASQTKRNNGVILMTTDDTVIRDSDSSGNNWGFYLFSSSNNTINNCTSNNGNGIYFYSSHKNTVNNCTSANSWRSFYLYFSSNNTINNCTSAHNNYGFYLSSSSDNTIINSTSSNNYYGIYLQESSNNLITNSTSKDNYYGIYLRYAGDTAPNHVYNNLFNNTQNVYFVGTIYANNWNTTKASGESIVGGPYLGGNAWLNPDGTGFSKNCSDADADGICDSSYTLETDNVDYLPLIIAAPPGITSYSPGTPVSGVEGKARTFSVDVNQTADVTWYVNGSQVQINSSVVEASYTNTSAAIGYWNVTAVASDADGSDVHTWWWTVAPAIIYVPDDYEKIQWAVENSGAGGTIIVRDGVYTENVDVDKRLTIRSENGSSSCIVQAADPNDHVFNVSADHVNISGFTVTGASGSNAAGVYLSSNYGNITDNNASNNYYGFYLSSSHNIITNSTSNNNERGFYLSFSSNNIITNSTSTNNYYGFYLFYSDKNIITNSTSTNNYYGFCLSSSNKNIITNSTAEENNAYDLDVYAYSTRYCDNRIQNLTGSNDLPILYYNSSVDLEDQVVSELVLCNADNSNIINVTVNASQTKRNNGIILMVTDDTHIRDSDSSGNNYGFHLRESNNNTITNSTSNDNGYGIFLGDAGNNTITNSTAEENNAYDLYVDAYSTRYCDNRIQDLTGSNDLPILYYNSSVDLEDQVVSELVLCNADNSNIINVTVNASQTKRNNGIILMVTDDTHIRDSDSSNNNRGFRLSHSNNNLITNSISNDNYYGFYIRYSSNNTITNSTSNYNSYGFRLYYSSSNTITNCTSAHNYHGFRLYYSINNLITNSTSKDNYYGIYLRYAGDTAPNHVYNNLFNNTQNVYFVGTIYANNWNTTKASGESIVGGPYLGGNAWLNPDGTGFSKNCSDADADGICDSSYTLETDNVDYLPLIVIAPTPPPDTTPPASITNLRNITYQPTYINWTWNNPLDDFNHTMVYLDGVLRENTSDEYYLATGLSPNTSYNISTHTVDAAGNINWTWVDHTATTAPPDTTPPALITDLRNTTQSTYINWTWNNPLDDFNHTMIYLDGVLRENTSDEYYLATGLTPNTSYSISTRTVDESGNVNQSWVNDSATTAPPDTTPPALITDLQNTTYQSTYINWTWNDSTSSDFDHVEVYLDGVFTENVSAGTEHFNATNLSPSTSYEIGTHAVDAAGNVNQTWVNHTATTAPDTIKPTPTPSPTPTPVRRSGGGGGGGGGFFLPIPTPTETPSPTPTPTEATISIPSMPSTPQETPEETPTATPTSTPQPTTTATPTPLWQQPTITITTLAIIIAALVILAYALRRK